MSESAPIDVEARVVGLALEDEQPGEIAEHAILRRQRDDLLLQRLAQVLVAGGGGLALMLDPRDARVDPRALQEGLGYLDELHRLLAGARARQHDLERLRRREVGVDEDLIARLHAVEPHRPHPVSARHGDLDVRDRRARQPPRQLGDGRRPVEHHAILAETGGHDLLERGIVANAANADGVEADHLRRRERLHRRLQILAVGLAEGGDAVADKHDARHPLAAGDRGQCARQVGATQRAARLQALQLTGAEVLRRSLEDRLGVDVEGQHAQLRLRSRAGELRHQLSHHS
jgi:hypothetical protein